jgi:hypothetical protein
MTAIQVDQNELSGKRALVTGGTKGMERGHRQAPAAGRRDGDDDRTLTAR